MAPLTLEKIEKLQSLHPDWSMARVAKKLKVATSTVTRRLQIPRQRAAAHNKTKATLFESFQRHFRAKGGALSVAHRTWSQKKQVSLSTLRRLMKEEGHRALRPRTRLEITAEDKQKRVVWAQEFQNKTSAWWEGTIQADISRFKFCTSAEHVTASGSHAVQKVWVPKGQKAPNRGNAKMQKNTGGSQGVFVAQFGEATFIRFLPQTNFDSLQAQKVWRELHSWALRQTKQKKPKGAKKPKSHKKPKEQTNKKRKFRLVHDNEKSLHAIRFRPEKARMYETSRLPVRSPDASILDRSYFFFCKKEISKWGFPRGGITLQAFKNRLRRCLLRNSYRLANANSKQQSILKQIIKRKGEIVA